MKCICKENQEEFSSYFKQGETDFIFCQTCGLLFRKKFPNKRELDFIYKDAYSKARIKQKNTNQEAGEYAAKKYANYIKKKLCGKYENILDFGTGTGLLVSELRKREIVADGLDFSEEARKRAKEDRDLKLFADTKEIGDGSYNIVSMIEVVEHLSELNATFQEIKRLIRPGGHLLITTPNRKSFRARMEGGNWREAKKKFHLILFDWQSLKFHLDRAGFTEIKRIKFSPVQRQGGIFWLYTRAMQLFGLGGTLCVVCKVPVAKI